MSMTAAVASVVHRPQKRHATNICFKRVLLFYNNEKPSASLPADPPPPVGVQPSLIVAYITSDYVFRSFVFILSHLSKLLLFCFVLESVVAPEKQLFP